MAKRKSTTRTVTKPTRRRLASPARAKLRESIGATVRKLSFDLIANDEPRAEPDAATQNTTRHQDWCVVQKLETAISRNTALAASIDLLTTSYRTGCDVSELDRNSFETLTYLVSETHRSEAAALEAAYRAALVDLGEPNHERSCFTSRNAFVAIENDCRNSRCGNRPDDGQGC